MSQLKTIIQDLINDRSEQAQSTIHQYLVQKMSSLTEAKTSFDSTKNHIIGGGKDWLEDIGATQQDLEKAFNAAKKLPSYKALAKGLTDITSATEAKSGTFAFKKDGGEFKSKYRVYAHGQLRSTAQADDGLDVRQGLEKPRKLSATSQQNQYKMPSPKPTVIKGDAYKSILATYDNAFQALMRSAQRTGRVKEDLDQLDEADATVKAYKINMPADLFPDLSNSKKIEKIFGEDEGDDSFAMNQEIVTIDDLEIKNGVLYVYPLWSDKEDPKLQQRLQAAFDKWARKQ